MRPRSLIMDIAIDQGGCVETSRPTTHGTPTYVEENVIHYCVPNMTGVVGRTATHALNNATWPFVQPNRAERFGCRARGQSGVGAGYRHAQWTDRQSGLGRGDERLISQPHLHKEFL